jgi:phosphoribosylanthranilate isomerase
MIRVKICGITRVEDAALAVDLGADAVGFIFWPKSPRFIAPAKAGTISRQLPPFVTRVGVFVDASPDEVRSTVASAGLDAAQLHGAEKLDDYGDVGARLIRSVALLDTADVLDAAALPGHVMPLVDTADPVLRGGTGRVGNWDRAGVLAGQRPIILAGGLTAENVADAVHHVQPWGIDVSSGVEEAPGLKDANRMRALFEQLAQLRAEGL